MLWKQGMQNLSLIFPVYVHIMWRLVELDGIEPTT